MAYKRKFAENHKDVESALKDYIRKVQDKSDNHYRKDLPNSWNSGLYSRYKYTKGGKYYKIVYGNTPDGPAGAAFAFVDVITGDIYKPASWASPAKGARGNIFDDNPPLTDGELYIR